jgi:hypothetical protein
MTTNEIVDYYVNLLILQYRGKPKARATIDALVRMAVVDQLPVALQNAFNLDTAEGVQLDTLGKIVGASRSGYDFSGPVTLDDENYRLFLRLAIVQNSAGSSLYDVQNILAAYFPDQIFVFDSQQMRINYFIDADAIDLQLAEFFIMAGRLPKPIGVQLGAIIYIETLDGVFGCRTNEVPGYEWDAGTTYDIGAVVEDGTSDNLYISLVASNLNNPVSDPLKWRLLKIPVGGFSTNASGLQGRCLTNEDFING